MNDDYNVSAAFSAIEDELIASMIRNMRRHKVEEIKDDKQWSMWQAEQLKSLEKYRVKNQKRFGNDFAAINKKIGGLIRMASQEGGMSQEKAILQAIRKGFKVTGRNSSGRNGATAEFFKQNDQKLEALIQATTHDMEKAEVAVLRRANDQYRKVIFNAQVYANTGAGTYEKAVDMATKDFLSRGIDCIEYANGSRHTISDYADMAIKTASKRAYLQAEGEKRKEWGISTVIMNKRGNPCPKCLPFCGKVLIDDVWSGGPKSGISPVTGIKYPLLSKAIAKGLYHPRCKDVHSTYFEGVSSPPTGSRYTKDELDEIANTYSREQKQQYAQRQAEKFERLEKYSLDEENQRGYKQRKLEWEKQAASYEKDIEKQEKSDTIKETLTRQLDNLSDEEKKTITEYTGFLAQELNSVLASKKILSARLQKKKEILEEALSKGVIPESITVIRKTIPEFMSAFPKGRKYTIGDVMNLKGKKLVCEYFMSTTLKDFSYPGRTVQINLHVPKGYVGAMYIKDLAVPKYRYQEEVLFRPGVEYVISSVEYRDGIYYMEANIIP